MSDVMLAAFRHDAHKFTGESHEDAREEFAGVPVKYLSDRPVETAKNGLTRFGSHPDTTSENCG